MRRFFLILMLLLSSITYGQKLKGNLKLGGEQDGEPFHITYDAIATGEIVPGSGYLKISLPVSQKTNVYFNYNNENKLKVVFQNGKSNVLYDIWNIEVEEDENIGKITTALATHEDVEGGKAKITLTNKMLRVVIVETNFAMELTLPTTD